MITSMMTKMKQNWMYKDVNEHFNFEKSLVLFIFLIFFYKRSVYYKPNTLLGI